METKIFGNGNWTQETSNEGEEMRGHIGLHLFWGEGEHVSGSPVCFEFLTNGKEGESATTN